MLFPVDEDWIDKLETDISDEIKSVPATMKIHQLILQRPGQFSVRDVSCFCSHPVVCYCFKPMSTSFAVKGINMMSFNHFMLIVILIASIAGCNCFLLQNKNVDCPLNCSCEYSMFRCSNRSLQNVPPIPNSGYCDIRLNNNQITTILPGVFKNLSTCHSCQLLLDNNSIHAFSDGAFDGIMNKTLSLQLRYNNLTSIPLAFQMLKDLRLLFLTGNPLKQLDTAVMVNIGHSLTRFEFDMASLVSWPYQLQYLRVLRTLIMGHIPFKSIPVDAFHGLEHTLENLKIHDSQLIKIPQAICILTNLDSIDFSSNHYLDEKSSVVTESCPTNLLKLVSFLFVNNNLEIFPSFFDMFRYISVLDVSNNELIIMIDDLFITKNFTVDTLYLDRNNFSRIPYAVNHLTSLQSLNIPYNFITNIDEPDISKLVNLQTLSLKGNPLMYISHTSFQNNLNLRYLDVSETKLRQIPSAVLYLTHLYSLTLEKDPIDCTCDLSYLKPWNNTGVISDGSMCFLSNEKIEYYLSQFLSYC